MPDSLWTEVSRILARELSVEASTLSDDKLLREDLAIDSIVALNLIFALERELEITVTEEDVVKLERVRDLRILVNQVSERCARS